MAPSFTSTTSDVATKKGIPKVKLIAYVLPAFVLILKTFFPFTISAEMAVPSTFALLTYCSVLIWSCPSYSALKVVYTFTSS